VISDDSKDLMTIEDIVPEEDSYTRELENKCFLLGKTIQDLNKVLQQKAEEIMHLKKLLEHSPSSGVVLPVSDEEEIASIQLEKIKQLSRERKLTLEEIKMYDLLVKNKRLSQGDVTNINGVTSLPKSLTKTDLIKIAGGKKK
jgi:hypothetical protein